MSTEQDTTSTNDYALGSKPMRRTRDDSYTALREAAERRRVQNRIAQRNSRRRNHERKAKSSENMKQQEENNATSSELSQNQHDDTNSNSEADTNHTAGSSISSSTGGVTGAKGDGKSSDMGRDNDAHAHTSWPMAYMSMQDTPVAIAPPMLFQNDRNCMPFQQDGFSHFPTPPEDMCHPPLDFPLQHHDLLSMHLHNSTAANMLPNHSMPLSSEVPSPFQAATRSSMPQANDMMNDSLPWMADGTLQRPIPKSNNNNNISARLQIVLDCIQSAGFPNFDELATIYYTTKFDSNSAADTEQKISRSRRLRDFLASLRQNSKRWTRWESRGYDREIIESAEEMYVDELQKLVSCLDGNNNILSHTHSRTESDHNPTASEISSDSSLVDLMMTTDETNQLKGLEAAMDTARYFQNRLPNIWALLMELAGHNGSQSELAVVTAVSILYHSRKNPELDFMHLIKHGLLEIPS